MRIRLLSGEYSMKKIVLRITALLVCVVMLAACGEESSKRSKKKSDRDSNEISIEKETDIDTSPSVIDIDTDTSISVIDTDTSVPVIDVEEYIEGYNIINEIPYPVYSGNESFDDIDYSVWEGSEYNAGDYVGRWYEEGFLNGYCLDIYGDGTWKLYAGDEIWGTLEAENMCVTFRDAQYGLNIMASSGSDEADMYMSVYINEIAKVRNLSSFVTFRREYDSYYCESLEDYYSEKYFGGKIAGRWEMADSGENNEFVVISEDGTWEYRTGNSALGVGMLEKTDENCYTTISGESARFGSFEYVDDGHIYIDNVMYEKIVDAERAEAPSEIVGSWYYYNSEAGEYYNAGYVFNSDWTFETLPDNEVAERGFFIRIGDNILLYDTELNQIHQFYQNEFMYGDSVQDDERESLVNIENY